MVEIVKRDGRKQAFNKCKIENAILKAMSSIGKNSEEDIQMANYIAYSIYAYYSNEKEVDIEKIQDMVIETLKLNGYRDVAKAYEEYREMRRFNRELNSDIFNTVRGIVDGTNEEVLTENANKKGTELNTQRDLIAGAVNRKIAEDLIPKDIMEAHRKGLLHIHDSDYYAQAMTNCCLVNLKDIFENGTVLNGVKIDPPKSLRTATTLATQIALAVSSGQYGGQTHYISDLAPFVRISKNKIIKKMQELDLGLSKEKFDELVDKELKEEIKDSIQTYNYQLNSMASSNGQSPFCTLAMHIEDNPEYEEETVMLIEEVLRQRIKGLKNPNGTYVTQYFPKLLYFMDENNAYEGSKYFWLTKLAVKCMVKRMSPEIISCKKQREEYGHVLACMGCRSFLSPWYDKNGEVKFKGRLNLGVQTINLPYVALLSQRENRNFFDVLDEKLQLCKRAGILRFEKLKGVKASVSPTLWCHGVFGRLDPDDYICDYIKDGYASVSLGYSGLYETVKILTGEDQTQPIGYALAIEIMKHLDDSCKLWKEETGLGFSVYGTPQESTGGTFCRAIQKEFGEIKDVTDKGFITNSYHIDVRQEIDAFSKLLIESKFAHYSLGGTISYVEVGELSKNLEAAMQLVQYMYENVIYGEINFTSDYCDNCDCQIEAKLDENLDWYCPNCGCKDKNKLTVTRRICGYIQSAKDCCKSRKLDILNRKKHL